MCYVLKKKDSVSHVVCHPFVTAAAIVVPCLSTLVSDHGKPLIHSYL